ncbi:DUF4112 domain-containing protein [Capnocytophaga genosp. AHN8471]|jgi:hypothetical protein|uniref:DUF4112 domain-containing protein n=1 Tax=Capnocytophaga genosp. AHN8471 TaxID=327574 RepID=UPI00193365BD|nr:DUF4112 domain-containing protein [Capnocytophaga genosp. AHN8471]MBM0654466.1 DUF4112 domain-containing protein [Capnocytophaga genosp. AHN8471]
MNTHNRSSRRIQQTQESISQEFADVTRALQREEKRRKKREEWKKSIEQSNSYQTVKSIKTLMDDYYLDPLLGLIPIVGDILPQIFNFSFFYVSIFKIKSYALTVTILRNILIDILVGIIPYLGIILDVFHKSYRKNFNLIVGFVNDDRNIIREVNQKAFSTTIWIAIIGVAIYYLTVFLWSIVMGVYHWIINLF